MESFVNAYKNFWSNSLTGAKFHSISRKNYFLICLLNSFLLTLPQYNLIFDSPLLFLAFIFFEFLVISIFMPLVAGVLSLISVISVISIFLGLFLSEKLLSSVSGINSIGGLSSIIPILTSPAVITVILLFVLRLYVYWKHLQFFNNRSLTVAGGRAVGWFPMVKINFFVGISLAIVPPLILQFGGFSKYAGLSLRIMAANFSQLDTIRNAVSTSPESWLIVIYLAGVLLVSLPLGIKNLISPTNRPTHHDYF